MPIRRRAYKLLLGLAGVSSVVGLLATSSQTPALAQGHAAAKSLSGLNIGVFMTDSTNNYETSMIAGAKAEAKKLGVKLTIVESQFNVQTQVNEMQLALQRKTYNAAIIITDASQEECNEVKKVIKAMPTVIATDTACGDGAPAGAVGFVGVQRPPTYAQWWNYIMSKNPHAHLAAITGPAADDTTIYTDSTLKSVLEKHSGVKLVANQATDYSTQQGYQATQDLLKSHPDINVIASNYAGMTQGVVQAVKASGKLGKVKIYDLLGDKYIVQQIKAGTVVATLPGLPASEMSVSVQELAEHWQGKTVPFYTNPLNALHIPGGPFVTKANVSKFHAEY